MLLQTYQNDLTLPNQIIYNQNIVVTTELLAKSLGVDTQTLRQNFNNNQSRYKEGEHFFLLKGEELKAFKRLVENFDEPKIDKFSPQAYLWTEKGAFNHVKSIGTDEAWEIFQNLVDSYFRLRKAAQVPQTYLEALKTIVLAEEQRLLDQQKIEQLTPKAEYTDKVLSSSTELTTTSIAKEFGMSAISLNKLLIERKVQYWHDGHYVLYQHYASKGYAKMRTYQFFGRNGESRTNHYLVWSEAGRMFIHTLLNPSLNSQITFSQTQK